MSARPPYTPAQRAVALAAGVVCHVAFVAGVGAMMAGLYTGLTMGRGPWRGGAAVVANAVLVAQFVVLHSILLARPGRRFLARAIPLGLGPALSTTTYATIASLQLLVTFAGWSPTGPVWWEPTGPLRLAFDGAYALAWLFLARTMADAGLAIQTGFLGWSAVVRGRAPQYGSFPAHGTFRWVRQPVYVAFACTLWTAPVWTADRLVVALAWTAYCVLGPRWKERRYLALHGERFARYRRLVPYWLPRGRPLDPRRLDGGGRAASR